MNDLRNQRWVEAKHPGAARGRALAMTAVFVASGVLVACQPGGEAVAMADRAVGVDEVIARGEYLVTLGGCHDCHTPLKMGEEGPAPDMDRALTGHPEELEMTAPPVLGDGPWMWVGAVTNTAFAGPWGVSYAINLTPDDATGIGIWTEEIFVEAMRTGRHMGQSRPIMPPMPWQNLALATDEDLLAIFAYLHSLPPTSNRVPAYQPPEGAQEPAIESVAIPVPTADPDTA